MKFVNDDETEGFFFIWTIQNFKYCLQKKGENLLSPRFKLNLSDTKEWSLSIYPKGDAEQHGVGVYLDLKSRGRFPIKVNSYFSVRATNGTFKKRDASTTFKYENASALGIADFLDHSELFKKGNDTFLENETLTLRCRIWKESPELPVCGRCYARTVINVKRIAFVWKLENFKELLHNGKKNIIFHTASSENQSFSVYIFLSGEFYNEKKIQVEIRQNAPYQESFVTCKLSLLDVDGKTDQSVREEHRFEDSQEMLKWYFTIMSAKKVLENEKLYLVNGALSLRFEFAVSYGEKYNEIERIEYGGLEQLHEEYANKTLHTSFTGSLKDNLQNFYKEGKLGDLIIRTASSKEFPVHKAILCARSEVFRAMFEHDTKEKRTGVVDIRDMNDDTVSKMLLFTYTDIVEELEWKAASQLYFAADKYGIVALKRECSTFLKDNLNSSNVCEALVLADMYQDQDMKSASQDFVLDHATEIVNSEYWKKFMQEKSNLAAETLQVLLMRKLKI